MRKLNRTLCATLSFTTMLTFLTPLVTISANTDIVTTEQDLADSAVSELYSDAAMDTFQELVEDEKKRVKDLGFTDETSVLENLLSELQNKKHVNPVALTQNLTVYDGYDWNFNMISASNQPQFCNNTTLSTDNPIKVAIIDSGINFSADINVAERKNFVNDAAEEEISILYEDFSGHGTNIAGLIAAQQNDIGITGGNPNVLLYSARVLDSANEAPISRVVEAIDWAIEKNVNIINLSFVTTTDSAELRAAIKRAYDANILIVAAAGNQGYVAYPAAYPEVMAIGSVNSKGILSSFSPLQGSIELLAPGELITSTDVFDTVSTHSGTSYAAPHITAIASRLWERDPSVSANYIRCVLDSSANLFNVGTQYGYGMVDYNFACIVFDALKPFAEYADQFNVLMRFAIETCGIQNPNSIPTTDLPENVVEGAWYADANGNYAHMSLLDGLFLKNDNGRAILMAGCIYADRETPKLQGMIKNPFFHGHAFYVANSDASNHTNYVAANYIEGTLYLTKIAQAMVRGNIYTETDDYIILKHNGQTVYELNNMIDNTYLNKRDKVKWSDITQGVNDLIHNSQCGNNVNGINFNPNEKIHRGLFIYGLALHNIADTFAHSSVWNKGSFIIRHDYADSLSSNPNRYLAASAVCKNALRQISKMNSSSNTSGTAYSSYDACDISIFNFGNELTEGVYLANFDRYAKEVCFNSKIFSSANKSKYSSDFFQKIDAGIYENRNITDGKSYFNPETGEFQTVK